MTATELPPVMVDIQKKIRAAVLAKDSQKAESFKYLFSLLEKEMLRKGSLSEKEAVKLLQKEMKSKKEALALFKKSGRKDLAKNEEREIGLLAPFLPEEAGEEKIRRIVKKIIAGGESNFGQIMGKAMAELKGMAEGSRVAQIVREETDQNKR